MNVGFHEGIKENIIMSSPVISGSNNGSIESSILVYVEFKECYQARLSFSGGLRLYLVGDRA